ncbi:hypothetical protein B484DRAFT_436120, partial [Ochromonadaceae sp. CCMP2298]
MVFLLLVALLLCAGTPASALARSVRPAQPGYAKIAKPKPKPLPKPQAKQPRIKRNDNTLPKPLAKQPLIKRNDNTFVRIERQSLRGDGLANVDGVQLSVPGTLPGDEATVKVLKTVKTAGGAVGYAKLVELGALSPQRVGPPCSIADRCGGCQLQHQGYSHQLAFKREGVQKAFTQAQMSTQSLPQSQTSPSTRSTPYTPSTTPPGGLRGLQDVYVHPVLASEQLHYRNKAQFAVQRQGGQGQGGQGQSQGQGGQQAGRIVLGLYAPLSNRVVDTKHCAIQHPAVNQALKAVRAFLIAQDEGGKRGSDQNRDRDGAGVGGSREGDWNGR